MRMEMCDHIHYAGDELGDHDSNAIAALVNDVHQTSCDKLMPFEPIPFFSLDFLLAPSDLEPFSAYSVAAVEAYCSNSDGLSVSSRPSSCSTM